MNIQSKVLLENKTKLFKELTLSQMLDILERFPLLRPKLFNELMPSEMLDILKGAPDLSLEVLKDTKERLINKSSPEELKLFAQYRGFEDPIEAKRLKELTLDPKQLSYAITKAVFDCSDNFPINFEKVPKAIKTHPEFLKQIEKTLGINYSELSDVQKSIPEVARQAFIADSGNFTFFPDALKNDSKFLASLPLKHNYKFLVFDAQNEALAAQAYYQDPSNYDYFSEDLKNDDKFLDSIGFSLVGYFFRKILEIFPCNSNEDGVQKTIEPQIQLGFLDRFLAWINGSENTNEQQKVAGPSNTR